MPTLLQVENGSHMQSYTDFHYEQFLQTLKKFIIRTFK